MVGKVAKFFLYTAAAGAFAGSYFIFDLLRSHYDRFVERPPTEIYYAQSTKSIEDLVVNISKEYKTTIKKSEEEGVKDIRKLAESSILEEAWAYLPKKSLWVELTSKEGYKITSERFYSSAEIDMLYLLQLAKNNDEIVLYHLHPAVSLMEEVAKTEIPSLYAGVHQGYFPSRADFMSMLGIHRMFKRINPNLDMIFKVVSTHGVVEYGVTEENEKYLSYSDADYEGLKGIFNFLDYFIFELKIAGFYDPHSLKNDDKQPGLRLLDDKNGDGIINTKIDKFSRSFSDGIYKVVFTSHGF